MKIRHIFVLILLVCTSGIYAQLGIKGGLNMANEIKSFTQTNIASAFSSNNLTGYQIGLVYQIMPKKSGFGMEISALLSQKGSSFSDSSNVADVIKQGYRELSYLEVPLNLRYRLTLGFVGIYGIAGIYGGYALRGKTVNEISNDVQEVTFQSFTDHLDYGFNLGAGLELFKKVQFGATWSQGVRNTSFTNTLIPIPSFATNRVFTINLVYMF